MKRRNMVAKVFELSLMVGASVAEALDDLAKVPQKYVSSFGKYKKIK